MSAAFFGAFQPAHLQITRGGWRLPSRTSHSPLSSPLASKNRRCTMQLVTLDVQFEAEPGAKLEPVQVMLRHGLHGLGAAFGARALRRARRATQPAKH